MKLTEIKETSDYTKKLFRDLFHGTDSEMQIPVRIRNIIDTYRSKNKRYPKRIYADVWMYLEAEKFLGCEPKDMYQLSTGYTLHKSGGMFAGKKHLRPIIKLMGMDRHRPAVKDERIQYEVDFDDSDYSELSYKQFSMTNYEIDGFKFCMVNVTDEWEHESHESILICKDSLK